MNTYRQALVCGVAVLLAVPFIAQAAEPSHRCAEQANDAQRLACYDAAFGKPRTAARAAAGAPAPAASTAAAAPAAPTVAVAQPAAATAAQVTKSGKAVVDKREAAAKPTTVTSGIASLKRMGDGRYEATLENGEVWAQVERDPRVEMSVGDTVTIRPAMLGSFMLVTASGLLTRVRRVK